MKTRVRGRDRRLAMLSVLLLLALAGCRGDAEALLPLESDSAPIFESAGQPVYVGYDRSFQKTGGEANSVNVLLSEPASKAIDAFVATLDNTSTGATALEVVALGEGATSLEGIRVVPGEYAVLLPQGGTPGPSGILLGRRDGVPRWMIIRRWTHWGQVARKVVDDSPPGQRPVVLVAEYQGLGTVSWILHTDGTGERRATLLEPYDGVKLRLDGHDVVSGDSVRADDVTGQIEYAWIP